MHGLGHLRLTDIPAALNQQALQGVFQKATPWHHRQTGGFVDDQQITVIVNDSPEIGD